MFDILRSFDGFTRPVEDLRVKTTSGAVVSIVAVFLMVFLFFSELSFYLTPEVVDHLFVNTTRGAPIRATFDITFPSVPCGLLSVDIIDDTGIPQSSSKNMIFKHKISHITGSPEGEVEMHPVGDTVKSENEFLLAHGISDGLEKSEELKRLQKPEACGNCYGAGGKKKKCCDTCADVKAAYAASGWRFLPQNVAQCIRESYRETLHDQYAEDGGCRLYGELQLERASGHFHIAPHKSLVQKSPKADEAVKPNPFIQLLELLSFTFDQFNITHTISTLRFGDQFPGIVSPLDGQLRKISDMHGMYQYYVKVVPTKFKFVNGEEIESNQFSVTEHTRHLAPGSGRGVPGVYFYYELSPVQAVFEEKKKSLTSFLTSVCAILGGLFTVMGMVDIILGFVLRFLNKQLL